MANAIAIDILSRVKFSDTLKQNFNVFYPYTMKDYERLDTLAFNYYGNSDYDFILYLSNDILDPWYGVYLNDDDFNDFITQKYGSIANAQQQTVYYQNNWYTDDTVLTSGAYSALDPSVKKYYDPILDNFGVITGYQRKQANTIVSTNQVLQLGFTLIGNTQFQVGEEVNSSANGTGLVAFANSTSLVIDNINGSFPDTGVGNKYTVLVNPGGGLLVTSQDITNQILVTSNNSYTVTGVVSNAVANVTSMSVIVDGIPALEEIYYSPVSYYDYEAQLNEQRKNIYVMNKVYLQNTYSTFKQLMAQ